MGDTYGFLQTGQGQVIRLFKSSLGATEAEILTDATNAPGAVPVAQSLGDALNGQTITHSLFTEASGHLKIVYIMDKAGNTKAIFTNLAKTGSPNMGLQPMYKPVQIEVGDQVRGELKGATSEGCVVLCFANGTTQHYSATGTTANTEMTEFRSGNGLGSAGTGNGPIIAYTGYAADGTVTLASIVDNQNVLKLNVQVAPAESFQAGIIHKLATPVQPNLNWKLSTTLTA